MHQQLRKDFPSLRSLEGRPNNLPQQVTSFVGRERELTDIRNQLGSTRLLTLFGAGGLGKTRLSLQVAAEVLDDYPDGVWFVDLAPMTDERLVPQAVALVLGVKEEAGRPVLEALVNYVSDRKLLVILDNCEHLLHSCGELATQLIRSGPHLRLLTSSRQPLHVAGETTYHVPSLSVPEPQRAVTIQALTQYEAVRLFVDRARAMQPSFQITDSNSRAVVGICHRLDGIPLALELAAARVRALSVDEIAARLNDRFHLLTGGDRTALPRQQTLRASIDWSYNLLTKQERALFRALSVFANGWTLEAAEAVGTAETGSDVEILDLLTNLVEKSLVISDTEDGRYRLLETVRQYALDRLRKSPEKAPVCDRHLNFYLTLAEQARPELVGPNQGVWLKRLDIERENFLAASTWCGSAENGADLGLKLAHALKRYWLNRGLLGLGYRICVDALGRSNAGERNAARCQALFNAGQLALAMGRYREALEHLVECLSVGREIEHQVMVAAVLQPLGLASVGLGDTSSARGYFQDAYALAQQLGDKRQVAAAINALAQLDRLQGNLDSAESLYEKALQLAREVGDREIIAVALLNLAMVSIGRASEDSARAMLLEVLAIADESGFKPAGQSALEVCAGLGAVCKDWEWAARFFGAAEAQIGETGLHRDPADESFLVPLIAKVREALGPQAYTAAEAAGRCLSYEAALVSARKWLEGTA